ncbi:hypothetical protein WAI453_011712 [Rhynchosporium graminicola]
MARNFAWCSLPEVGIQDHHGENRGLYIDVSPTSYSGQQHDVTYATPNAGITSSATELEKLSGVPYFMDHRIT